jgi:virginiamycin B lyase
VLSAITYFPRHSSVTVAGPLAAGPDGNLWFGDGEAGIGRITPSGNVTVFPFPTGGFVDDSLTVGPDGNLWFPEKSPFAELRGFREGKGIGRITSSGAITEFSLPAAGPILGTLTVGPDGNLWFPELHGSQIGMITPTGSVTEFPVPSASFGTLSALTVGPDGDLWFNDGSAGIGRITPSGAITVFPLTKRANGRWDITALMVGPDGNLWFGDGEAGIGRITPSGTIRVFRLPAAGMMPGPLTAGPDGKLWFGASSGKRKGEIDRITRKGAFSGFAIPTALASPDIDNTALTEGPTATSGSLRRLTAPSAGSNWRNHVTGAVEVEHAKARITAIALGFDVALHP